MVPQRRDTFESRLVAYLRPVAAVTAILAFALTDEYVAFGAMGDIFLGLSHIYTRVLLRQASNPKVIERKFDVHLQLQVATKVPYGYTATLSGRNPVILDYTPQFRELRSAWEMNSLISLTGTGCEGICSGWVWGVGLASHCHDEAVDFDLQPRKPTSPRTYGTAVEIFKTGLVNLRNGTFVLSSTYKSTTDCAGTLTHTTCTLRPALVSYPIVANNYAHTIYLHPNTDISSEIVIKDSLPEDLLQDSGTLEGYLWALSDRFSPTANIIFFGGAGGQMFVPSGTSEL